MNSIFPTFSIASLSPFGPGLDKMTIAMPHSAFTELEFELRPSSPFLGKHEILPALIFTILDALSAI